MTTENSSPTSSNPESARSGVLFLSGDLIFASRVRAAASNHGRSFELSGSIPSQALDVAFVIVDLSTRAKAVEGLVDACARWCPAARVIAYGPHVQVAKLKAAREAGVPTVLTRGQFDAALSSDLLA
ncbi:hypothetical protein Pla100_32740 [Neorhodopirellula pilleata]|uniref:Response regulatory domain-containing protein n=2 Tax=Neorhodopirellula pilleata TaxID=2714738 RepID=A0A5C6ABD3_9BACT|nr:hypothetical protein Pla100_32740 [Neorhodopirellula pilleata]